MSSSNRTFLLVAMLLTINGSGCVMLATKLNNCTKNFAERRQIKSEIHQVRHDQRQAEIQHEHDCMRAELENAKRGMQSQFQQRLKSQLSIDLAQQIQFGEIKVDADKLQSLIEDAKKADEAAEEAWKEQEAERVKNYKEQLRDYAHKHMIYEEAQARIQAAKDCGQPATACDCAQPAPPCKPTFPVLEARTRPRQTDLALRSLPLTAEIQLNLNSSNPRIEQARNQTFPSEQALACKRPCTTGESCTTVSGSPCYQVAPTDVPTPTMIPSVPNFNDSDPKN